MIIDGVKKRLTDFSGFQSIQLMSGLPQGGKKIKKEVRCWVTQGTYFTHSALLQPQWVY